MITKIYWITRLLGYIACLAGIFYYLAHQADSQASQIGIGIVGFGFVSFFASYALRVWLRYGSRPAPDEENKP